MTKVIINADDFGKSVNRNKAIDVSFKKGLIRSAGLIVTGVNLQQALDFAFLGGYVRNLHLHFNLSANLLHENSEDAPLTDALREDSYFCVDGKFKRYSGLPLRISTIRKWKIIYKELVAQFEKFKILTKGQADYNHVDFHLWYNLTWPVSVALNIFTWKYRIKSVRYIGEHQKKQFRCQYLRIFPIISWNTHVTSFPATNIDYFLSKSGLFSDNKNKIIELYCHPNYKEDVFLDDSPSYLNHERQPMEKQIQMLREVDGIEFISWEDIQ